MSGRDPHELHRAATPLELLYDLTFVVAFGAASNEAAHYFAEGHWRTGLIGFGFAMFAVIWAWIQNTWFASAYDTDDWIYRLLTMVQMVGVLVLALGLPLMFESIEQGDHVDNGVMVLGYVIMRAGLVALWLRVASHDVVRRRCRVHLREHASCGPGRLDRAGVGRRVDCRHVLGRCRARDHRADRPGCRRAPLRHHHPVASAPCFRAIRTADDHHARRSDPRHSRRDQRCHSLRRMDRRDCARRTRRRRTRVRHVVDVLRDPERRVAGPLPQPIVRLGIRAPAVVRWPRCDGRGTSCGRSLHRARGTHRPARSRPHDCRSTRRLRDLPVHPLQHAHPRSRPVSPLAGHRHGGGHRCGDHHGRRRRSHRCLPPRARRWRRR